MNQGSDVKACIDETQKCAVACLECAQACLNEKDLEMLRECIKTDLECAAICEATSWIVVQVKTLLKYAYPFVKHVLLNARNMLNMVWNIAENVLKRVESVPMLVGN